METHMDVKELDVKVVHHVDRVNLFDFGYERAGSVKGDPDVYVSYLNRIMNGDLVEKGYDGISDDQKKERTQQIIELESKLIKKNWKIRSSRKKSR